MLIKQKSLSLPRDLALRTFGELLIVFSTKEVNFKYLPQRWENLKKILKRGWKYGAGAGLFKRKAGTFSI